MLTQESKDVKQTENNQMTLQYNNHAWCDHFGMRTYEPIKYSATILSRLDGTGLSNAIQWRPWVVI
jgi:hypothetical protein